MNFLPTNSAPEKVSFITVETTTFCNLKCPGCSRTVGMQSGHWQNKHMPASVFAKVVKNLPKASMVTLHGIGEPTLNPDLPEIFKIAKESEKFDGLTITTNGLTKEADYYGKLIDNGLTLLTVSVDSLNPTIANKARTGTDVEKLRKSLMGMKDLPVAVRICIVAGKFNLLDIPSTLGQLNEMGNFEVRIQLFQDIGNPAGCLNDEEKKTLVGLIKFCKPRCPQLKIEPGFDFNLIPSSSPSLCDAPWKSPAVTVDGFWTPCCIVWDPTVLENINLAEVSFADAWKSDFFQKFISDYVNCAPDFCHGCPQNTRETKGKENRTARPV